MIDNELKAAFLRLFFAGLCCKIPDYVKTIVFKTLSMYNRSRTVECEYGISLFSKILNDVKTSHRYFVHKPMKNN